MPRISYDKRKKAANDILRNIKAHAGANDISKERIAEALHCSTVTVYNRFKEPENLTLEELMVLANLFNVTLSTLLGI